MGGIGFWSGSNRLWNRADAKGPAISGYSSLRFCEIRARGQYRGIIELDRGKTFGMDFSVERTPIGCLLESSLSARIYIHSRN